MSSPGTYLRYSANSMLEPLWGLLCWPLMLPAIGSRACTWPRMSRASAFGSRKSCVVLFTRAASHFRVGARFLDEPADDFLARDAFAFRVEAGQNPMHQHRLGERLNILDSREVAA